MPLRNLFNNDCKNSVSESTTQKRSYFIIKLHLKQKMIKCKSMDCEGEKGGD